MNNTVTFETAVRLKNAGFPLLGIIGKIGLSPQPLPTFCGKCLVTILGFILLNMLGLFLI